MSTLRPLFITGSLAHGGAERQSITLVNALAGRGHACGLVYIKDDTSQLSRLRQHDLELVHGLRAHGYLDAGAIAALAGDISRFQPSLLVAVNGYALMMATLARQGADCSPPIVVTFHTTQLLGSREWVKSVVDRPFFWAARRTIFVCDRQRRHWLRRGLASRHNSVIYNGVDIEHFRDRSPPEGRRLLREGLGFAGTDFVIGISAVLRPEKNHQQLIQAVAVLRGMGVPARLLIIGDGPLRDDLERLARRLGLADSMRITGFTLDVRPYLSACDVAVLCSTSVETFSLAALEAMAMGRPVVHADLGGAAEMITPGHNGLLFPVGNTPALVRQLLLVAEPGRAAQMGQAARRMVETRFSENLMVDRYEQLLLADSAPQTNIQLSPLEQGARSHEHL